MITVHYFIQENHIGKIQGSSSEQENSNILTREAMPTPGTSNAEPPLANKEWHVGFIIPDLDVFSTQVQQAISTGVVTGSARREIVQVLRTYVLAHTSNPKSEHYNAVCRKLVDKYPKLQDTEGETLYVSEANKSVLF